MAHDLPAWIALSLHSGRPSAASRALVITSGDPRAALRELAGLGAAAELDRAERLAATLPRYGVVVLALPDRGYPPLLREIPDPPPVLFVRGRLDDRDDPAVAIVGSRRATTYGEAVARYLAEDLAGGGVTVSRPPSGCADR